jgi:hypothetical protein
MGLASAVGRPCTDDDITISSVLMNNILSMMGAGHGHPPSVSLKISRPMLRELSRECYRRPCHHPNDIRSAYQMEILRYD